VDHINAVIQEGDPENTLLALKKPEAQLPAVYPFAAAMYQNELLNLQKQNAMVRHSHVQVHTVSRSPSSLTLALSLQDDPKGTVRKWREWSTQIYIKTRCSKPGTVAHAWNPSYSEVRRISVSRSAQEKAYTISS
jgi:hypothetical protein